jgi:signal transduction histidine kinase
VTFPFGGSFVGAAWAAGAREPEIHWPKSGWTLDDSSLIVVGGALPDTAPRFELGIPRAAALATADARAAWLHALAALVALPLCVGVLLAGRARRETRLRDTESSLAEARLRAAEAEAAASRAELAAVNARLDPHFLSNALHSVAALVDSDPAAAEDALDRLGDLFRYSLEQSERHTVLLGDEWRFVRDYLAIEQMRLGERLAVRMDLDPDAAAVEVPSLLLQPLVENAVRHGVGPRREGGTVRVGARRSGDRLELEVADDGVGTDPQSLGTARGTGLRTLRQRLDLDPRFDGRLAVETAPGEGFRVHVSLAV